jgi:Phosphotransferase enzyme family
MPHGYTNATTGDGTVVVKRYLGPDAAVRSKVERGVLGRLRGLLPVPDLQDDPLQDDPLQDDPGAPDRTKVTLGFVHGSHGQDLLGAGRAAEVLPASGGILARIHDLDVTDILPGSRPVVGEVLVHGDFGPNNLLFDSEVSRPLEVVAVLDWEWAHVGQRVEDLAWCEWIVRMHHPEQVGAMDAFFAGYGARPSWAERQAAMLARCLSLSDFCQRWDPAGAGLRQWQSRSAVTAHWVE